MKGFKYGDGFAIKPVAEMLPGERMLCWCATVDIAMMRVDCGGGEFDRAHQKAPFHIEPWMLDAGREDGACIVDLRDEWHRRNT